MPHTKDDVKQKGGAKEALVSCIHGSSEADFFSENRNARRGFSFKSSSFSDLKICLSADETKNHRETYKKYPCMHRQGLIVLTV